MSNKKKKQDKQSFVADTIIDINRAKEREEVDHVVDDMLQRRRRAGMERFVGYVNPGLDDFEKFQASPRNTTRYPAVMFVLHHDDDDDPYYAAECNVSDLVLERNVPVKVGVYELKNTITVTSKAVVEEWRDVPDD